MSVVGDAWVHVRPELSGFPGELTSKVTEAVQGASEQTKSATAEMSAAWDRLEAAEARAAAGAESAAAASRQLVAAQAEAAAAAREQTDVLIGSDTAATRAADAQARLAAAEERAGLAGQAAAAKQAQLAEAQSAAALAGTRAAEETARSGGALEAMAAVGQKVAIGVVAGLAIVGVAAAKLANDFDVSQRQMQAQGGFTEKQAEDIGKAFLSTGGQVTFSAQQMMDAFGPVAGQLNELAGHTLSAKEALDFERQAVDLAEASHLDLKATTAALANVMQAFGVAVGDASHAADVLQNTSRLTNIPLDQLTVGVDRLHGRLGPLSPSLEDTNTLLAALSEAGQRGTRSIQLAVPALDSLTASSGKSHDTLAALGVTVVDSSGKFVGMQSVIAQLGPKLAGMSEDQRKSTEQAIFGTQAWGVFDTIIRKGADSYGQLGEKIGEAGSAQHAAEVNTSSLRGESEKFLSGMKDLGVELGQFLVPILKTLVSGLGDAVNWFKQNEGAAIAVGAALGTLASVFIGAYLITKIEAMVVMLGQAKAALIAFGDTSIVEAGLSRLGFAFTAAGSGATSLFGTLTTLAGGTGLAVLGLGALTIAAATYVGAQQQINDSNKANDASFKQWASDLPHASFEEVTASLHTLNAKLGDNQTSWLQDAQAMVGFDDQFTDTARSVQAGVGPVQQAFGRIHDATELVAKQMGITNDAAFALLKSLNLDWNKTSIDDAVTRLHQSLANTTQQTQVAEGALEGLAAISARTGTSVQDLAKAEDDAGKKAADAFMKANDVVSAFSGKIGTTSADIKKFYTDNIKSSEQFSADIQKAMAQHLDPQLIARLLEAGPQQAGPVLHAMVTNVGGDFTGMVNDSEGKFRQMSQAAAEMARLTQRAIEGGTDQWSKDLSSAMQAEQIIMFTGGHASVKALTDQLHIGGADLARTLGEYGITFQLSGDDYQRLMQSAGKDSADKIAAALAAGKPLTVDQLNQFKAAFDQNATDATNAGAAGGAGFADHLTGEMRARLAALGVVMSDYDASIQGGLNPILSTVGGQPVNLSPQQSHDIIGLPGKAAGGHVGSASLFVAGEAGPETIISHDPMHRAANLGYWATAGKALGVPGFQGGGFTDPSMVPKPNDAAFFTYGSGQSFGGGTDALAHKLYDATVAKVAAMAAAVSSSGGSPFGGGPVKAYMLSEVAKRWPGEAEAAAFDYVEMREAGYDANAQNPTSPAAGLAQNISGFGPGYERGNVQQQTAWMLNYIAGRYGDPIGAAAHERAFNWYDNGGWWPSGSLGMNMSGAPELVLPGNVGGSILGLIQTLAGGPPPGVAGGGQPLSIDASVHVAGNADAQAVTAIANIQAELVALIRKVVAEGNSEAVAELAARGIRAPNRLPGAG